MRSEQPADEKSKAVRLAQKGVACAVISAALARDTRAASSSTCPAAAARNGGQGREGRATGDDPAIWQADKETLPGYGRVRLAVTRSTHATRILVQRSLDTA